MKNESSNKLSTSFIFNVLYEAVKVICPLLIIPKISRAFGVDYLGIKSYTYSIVFYFGVFGILGLHLFGQKEIAQNKANIDKRSEIFKSISYTKFLTFSLSLIIYIVFILLSNHSMVENICFFCWILYLAVEMLDTTWFFQGLEKFKLISIINASAQLLYTVCTYIFINSPKDLPFYILIYNSFSFIAVIIYRIIASKHIKKAKINFSMVINNIKQSIVYFIPTFAIAIYSMFDKTMLGIFDTTKHFTGLYEASEKIVKIALSVATGMFTIMRARCSNLYVENKDLYLKQCSNFTSLTMMFAFPIIAGIISIAPDFIPVFFGSDFNQAILLTEIMAIIVLPMSLSGLLQSIFIIPSGRQNQINKLYLIVSLTNLLLNIPLIYFFNALGAIIASIISETLLFILMIIFLRGEVSVGFIIKKSYKYIVSSILMFAIVFLTGKVLNVGAIFKIALEILIGIISYFAICILLRDNFLIKLLKRVFKYEEKI